jgi:hypothetical protein
LVERRIALGVITQHDCAFPCCAVVSGFQYGRFAIAARADDEQFLAAFNDPNNFGNLFLPINQFASAEFSPEFKRIFL